MGRLRASGRKRLLVAAAVVTAAAAILCFYAMVNPDSGWMPRCPVKMLSGWDCPGCGSQRALHALLNGDFAGAWQSNAMMIIMVPIAVAAVLAEMFPRRLSRLHRMITAPAVIAILLVAIAAWTFGRNLL